MLTSPCLILAILGSTPRTPFTAWVRCCCALSATRSTNRASSPLPKPPRNPVKELAGHTPSGDPCGRRSTSRKPQPWSRSLRPVVVRVRPLRHVRPNQGHSANRPRVAILSQGRVVASTPSRQPKRTAYQAPAQPVAKTQVPGCKGFHFLQAGLPRFLRHRPPLRPRYRLQRGSLIGPRCTPR